MQMKTVIGKSHCSAFTFINLQGTLAGCDFCQHNTIFTEKCVRLLAVPIEFNISEFTF